MKTTDILLYETGSGYGGSAVSLYRLVKCLDPKRFTPHVVVHGIGPKIREISALGFDVHSFDFVYPIGLKGTGKVLHNAAFYGNFLINNLANATRITKIIRRAGIKLVHLNNGIFEGFPGLLAARLARIPCVTHVRGTVPITRLERMVAPWVHKVITLNSFMQNEYAACFGAHKVSLIFNGVDIDRYENVPCGTLRKRYDLDQDQILIGTVARLVSGKGIPEFISAAQRVLKAVPNALFFVIGDDPFGGGFEEEQKRLCYQLGIEPNVRFTGWVDDIPAAMADLDIVVQVSTFPEGMSLVPIEAMALGKPVITSDVPGYADTVLHDTTGFIVPAGDVETLADRILGLITDRRLSKTMGTLGRRRVEAKFDSRQVARNVEDIYALCLEHQAAKSVIIEGSKLDLQL